mmetsp:Transcript_9986/g.20594  ORF Transcript_9986/g.20594 Transcript_9986/m.20594 type:complete len:1705 (+) Transcript_9986:253-5367(+)
MQVLQSPSAASDADSSKTRGASGGGIDSSLHSAGSRRSRHGEDVEPKPAAEVLSQMKSDSMSARINEGVKSVKKSEEQNHTMLQEIAFVNEGERGPGSRLPQPLSYGSGLHPAAVQNRQISNQSTIDSGVTSLSGNSRVPGRGTSGVPRTDQLFIEKQRRINLLMDQCETVKFPFKKKLILANMNLAYDEVPVEHICSARLGTTLYKFSLAGNPLFAVPDILLVRLTGLRVLDLSQCELRDLPESWDFPSLKRLNLSHNRLDEFLNENILRGLPELQHLDMYGNKLVTIAVPEAVSLISKVEYLDVGYNNLASLPDDMVKFISLRTLKCMNNMLEIIPAAVCDMDLRVFDVSSNPLIQPPLETCERGLLSMRRYYHCLKLEEEPRPSGPQCKSIFKKMKSDKPKSKMRKRKDFVRKTFPAALCRSGMFRSISEPAHSTDSFPSGSKPPNGAELSASLFSSDLPTHQRHRNTVPDRISSFEDLQETPPMRSVSLFPSTTESIVEEVSADGLSTHVSELSISEKKPLDTNLRINMSPPKSADKDQFQESMLERERTESDYSDGSISSDVEGSSTEGLSQLIGFNEAEKIGDEITVNDTLKVIFVGMALSGKTSIIKRLIEGRGAMIPQMDERTIGVDIYEWDPKTSNVDIGATLNTEIVVDGELQNRMKGAVDVKFSVWDFAGQHVYHATHELFFSRQSLYVLVWDMGANNSDTKKRRSSLAEDHGAFKLTYDSSDEEDDFFDAEQENRRVIRALEQDIDDKLQFWIDSIQSSAPGAAILPVASFDDHFSDLYGSEEAAMRCKLMRERLQKHEERRTYSMRKRLEEYNSKFGPHSEVSLRLRKLLCPFNRPKIIFGTGSDNSVVRVSSTEFTGFDHLAEKIVNIATGREKGNHQYPVFRGHIGARIPRMRLEVRDVVRSMRDRFKVVEWGFFLSELEKKGIDNAEDVSDALHFLANIGELSYFGYNIPSAIQGTNNDEKAPLLKKTSSVYDNIDLAFDEEDLSPVEKYGVHQLPCRHQNGDVEANRLPNSLGLSEFIFLNPRWLVAAVACILRHDLTREIYELRRVLRRTDNSDHSEGGSFREVGHLQTDVNYPVITAHDACLLWQAKRFTKKAAERALEYSNNRSVTPFDFLQRLLIRFGVFVPIDLSIDKACLGGRDYSRYSEQLEYPEVASNIVAEAQAPKHFFLPSLLGPGEPSEIWTFKTVESWKTTICHSILFPDGVPPGLMERITASVLSDLYTNQECVSDRLGLPPPPNRGADCKLRIKETLCWRSAFFLKVGKEVLDRSTGVKNESMVEIFATLVDQDSHLCVASDSMGVGMRRLIFCGKGQAGDMGSNIWEGGYLRVLKKGMHHVMSEYGGLELERQAICPYCLAKKPISQASLWDASIIEAHHSGNNHMIRCRYGHSVDVRLLTGTSSPSSTVLESQLVVGEADVPVSELLKAVVLIGVWDEEAQRIIKAGSGFIVDKKRGLIVSAGHTLMDKTNWREMRGKIVVGIIPKDNTQDDPVAVFRYFARIIAKDPSISESGVCKLDACILQITTRMEKDVRESGSEIGEQPETLLMNSPEAMKGEHFDQLKVSYKFELDEAVRILGFNQGGEGLIGPGEELNRCADFARGYVVMKFAVNEITEQSTNRKFQPRSEIVVICPTIGGHSGGPCVNQQGEVIGILSRADPADKQRCYLVPSSEWKALVKDAKKFLASPRLM